MLTIDAKQMRALNAAASAAFLDRLAVSVRTLFTVEVKEVIKAVGEDNYRKALREAVDRAAHFGLEREADVAVFVALSIANRQLRQSGQDFLGWTRPLMERTDIAGPVKLALIEHRLRRQALGDQRAARLSEVLTALRG